MFSQENKRVRPELPPIRLKTKEDFNSPLLFTRNPTEPANSPESPIIEKKKEAAKSQTLSKEVRKMALSKLLKNDNDEDEEIKLEDGFKSKYEYQKLQIAEISVAISSLIAIFISIMAYDIEFDEKDDVLLDQLLYSVFCLGLCTVVINILRYNEKIRYLKSRNILPEKATLISSGEIWNIIMETILVFIQPYPWITTIKVESRDSVEEVAFYYFVNDILYVLMMVRFIIIIRVILNLTIYTTPSAERVNLFYGAKADYKFAVKCLMKEYPILSVSISMATSILIFGYMLRICERPLKRSEAASVMMMSDYWNSMWCVILTMTTVGYGDFYAKTTFGRLVSVICGVWGVFICSLVVVTLNNILEMSSAEEKSFAVLERVTLRKELAGYAGNMITCLTKGIVMRKKKAKGVEIKDHEKESRKLAQKLQQSAVNFRRTLGEIKLIDDATNENEALAAEFDHMRKEITELRQKQDDRYNDLVQSINQIAESLKSKVGEKSTPNGKRDEDETNEVIPLLPLYDMIAAKN